MNAINIKHLSKIYSKSGKEVVALSDVNLKIREGSFFGLLGRNGAGKSTLINILSGLTIKTNGIVTINGFDLDKNNIEARYSLGVVPQELILDPFFTVRETIINYCNYYAVPNAKKRADEIIQAIALEDKADTKPRKLSGGMQRRLLVAKALVHQPKILILDEPTAGVDIELRKQLWDYVVKLNKAGTTIILTTHYLEEAQELCDFIAILDKGKLIHGSDTESLMNILDYKEITIRFDQEILNTFEKWKDFDYEMLDSNLMKIKYKHDDQATNKILNIANENNLTIKDISTSEADLEDIFSYLINKNSIS